MSLVFPTNAREVNRSGWLLAPFLIGPMVLPFVFWWEVHVTFDAFMKMLPLGTTLGLVLGWLMYKRSMRLVELDLHPYFSRSKSLPWTSVVAMLFGTTVVTWGWLLVLLAIVILPATPSQQRLFTISEVEVCTRKCLGCSTQVKLSNWVGSSGARLCANGLEIRPRVGEKILIRGRFSELVQYVAQLERPHG